MQKITTPAGRTVLVPSTGRDWQLYASSMDCEPAAKALTAALSTALAAMEDNGGGQAWKFMKEHVYPTMSEYSEFGAYDTEPRCIAEDVLEEFAARC